MDSPQTITLVFTIAAHGCNKILLIKFFRHVSTWGLKETKEFVESVFCDYEGDNIWSNPVGGRKATVKLAFTPENFASLARYSACSNFNNTPYLFESILPPTEIVHNLT